jgi:hypothetical protein
MVTQSPILTDGLSLVGGALGGCLLTLAVGLIRLIRRRHAERVVAPQADNSYTDERIDEAAACWAAAHGQPEAADLIARKLRLTYRLTSPRQDRRWSR